MYIEFLLEVFRRHHSEDAIVWQDRSFSYAWMGTEVERWREYLNDEAIAERSVVSLEADFSPTAVALMLALVEHGCIMVPMTASVEPQKPEFRAIAEVEVIFVVDKDDQVQIHRTRAMATHELLLKLKNASRPGLILFSSGSTGKRKAVVHDFVALLEKFKIRRHSLRTVTFLLFDHIGGLNTLLYSLSNGGCVVTIKDRSPDAVCLAIEKYRAQLLPTSPTFINLLLLSEAVKRYDLSSLQLVTYGTEVMPESTLKRFHELLPHVRLMQTYGLSEVGILRSKSKASDSLWMKVGGEGVETRIVDGMLEIKTKSAMMGYLNASKPFTEDGWFRTEDAVEVDGEYVRFLGRRSEVINVGGEKVYPAEVESVLHLMDGVEEVVVSGEANLLTGQIVKTMVKLSTGETVEEFRRRMQLFCRPKLANYMIPQKVVLAREALHNERFKQIRGTNN
jgi:long-chain acyl-CoA synthetase